jgi:hypothetical protein
MPQNPFYVYALKDPRKKPAKPFYIGKGTGNRAWEHQTQIDDSEKGEVIKGIHEAGYSVLHTVVADNLTEEQALKLEAELISAFGIRKHGGLLTNKVRPNPNNISKRIKVNILMVVTKKRKWALNLLRQLSWNLRRQIQMALRIQMLRNILDFNQIIVAAQRTISAIAFSASL